MKKKDHFAPDPPHRWVRKDYDASILDNLTPRQRSELETDRDLDKSLEQLVCDVHEETHNQTRPPIENIASAQKRMVSMMARVAMTNENATKWMIRLTWAIVGLTAIIVFIAIFK